jgi:hypothetical protein
MLQLDSHGRIGLTESDADRLVPSTLNQALRLILSFAGWGIRARLRTDNARRKDSDGQLRGQFSRKFSEVTVAILISLVALGAGKFPYCKSDEGNRVSFGSASSHVLTENYSVSAFRVFALDAIISLYGHVGHLPA